MLFIMYLAISVVYSKYIDLNFVHPQVSVDNLLLSLGTIHNLITFDQFTATRFLYLKYVTVTCDTLRRTILNLRTLTVIDLKKTGKVGMSVH